jgi:stage IV sporulation protein FB
MPEKPVQELLVALAGPAVNVGIAGVLFVIVGFPNPPADIESILQIPFGQRLLVVNISLVLFNMIPAFPMDGGRVLRALLAMLISYGRATEVAATVGQLLAVLGAIFAIKSGALLLVLIALFIFLAARSESRMVQARIALAAVPWVDLETHEARDRPDHEAPR